MALDIQVAYAVEMFTIQVAYALEIPPYFSIPSEYLMRRSLLGYVTLFTAA